MPPVMRMVSESAFGDHVDALISAAREVRHRAYARYSNFMVGAAVLTADGRIHVGVNVECVDYDVTHAEESAFSAMAAAGGIAPVMIVAVGAKGGLGTDPAPIVSPCGKCRQKIYEWIRGTSHEIDVIVADPQSGQPTLCSIRELLPVTFG